MKHLAITGNIGSGKSTACRFFERLDIPVYYSDARAKKLMIEDQEVIGAIKDLLGEESYSEDGTLNRSHVASKIFSDQTLLQQMNQIVHPAVRKDYHRWRENQDAVFTLQESALTSLFHLLANPSALLPLSLYLGAGVYHCPKSCIKSNLVGSCS